MEAPCFRCRDTVRSGAGDGSRRMRLRSRGATFCQQVPCQIVSTTAVFAKWYLARAPLFCLVAACNSTVSALVLANNDLGGCIPSSIGKMGGTLNEILLLNNNLSGCIPPEIGQLKQVTVFDVGSNKLGGPLPTSVGDMKSAEQLNVAHNQLMGVIPSSICQLKRLENFTYSYNYFTGGAPQCLNANRVATDSKKNYIPGFPAQRSFKECAATPSVDCSKESAKCRASQSPSPVAGRPPFSARGRRRPSPPPAPVSRSHPMPRIR